jgi:hypothetical protein
MKQSINERKHRQHASGHWNRKRLFRKHHKSIGKIKAKLDQ